MRGKNKGGMEKIENKRQKDQNLGSYPNS